MRAHDRTDAQEAGIENLPFWWKVLGWFLLPLFLALLGIGVVAPSSTQKVVSSASKTDCLSRGGAWAKADSDAAFHCVKPLEEMK